MSLEYEPSSEPLHISAKWLSLNDVSVSVVTDARVPRSKMRVALHEKEEEEEDEVPEETGEDAEEALSPSSIRYVSCLTYLVSV